MSDDLGYPHNLERLRRNSGHKPEEAEFQTQAALLTAWLEHPKRPPLNPFRFTGFEGNESEHFGVGINNDWKTYTHRVFVGGSPAQAEGKNQTGNEPTGAGYVTVSGSASPILPYDASQPEAGKIRPTPATAEVMKKMAELYEGIPASAITIEVMPFPSPPVAGQMITYKINLADPRVTETIGAKLAALGNEQGSAIAPERFMDKNVPRKLG